MDLYCCEATVDFECRAYADPVLLKDNRVLNNLLSSEDRHVLSSSYFDCVQLDLKPHMRKVVTQWMLEVGRFLLLRRLLFQQRFPFWNSHDLLLTGHWLRLDLQLNVCPPVRRLVSKSCLSFLFFWTMVSGLR